MADQITKLNDVSAIVREIRAIYALLSKIEGRLESLSARIDALEP